MKITFLSTTLQKGGAEKQLFYLIKGLKERKVDVSLISLEGGEYQKKYEELGINLTVFEKNKSKNIFKYIPLIKQKINEIKPDIIHSFLFHTNILLKLTLFFMKKKCKIICSYRAGIKKFPLIYLLEYINMHKVDLLISNSESNDIQLKDYFWMKNKRRVIHNGAHFEPLKNELVNKNKQQYKDQQIILTVANMRSEKDYMTNIKTAQLVNQKIQNTKFLYVGDGPQEKKIREKINEQKISNIELIGRRKDINELINISKVFFLPTKNEGQSNSLIEAMHGKLPIVTTNILANTMLVPHAEYCEIGNYKAMAKKIINILKKDYSQKKLQENKAKVETKLLLENMITNYQKTYEELLCAE